MSHLFTCPSEAASHHRSDSLAKLKKVLESLRTPLAIVTSIIHGLSAWADSQVKPSLTVHAPSRGSVRPADIILTQAFTEQTNELGWEQFLRGRISTRWGAAYTAYTTGGRQQQANDLNWATKLILAVWDYAISIWRHRNEEVHGASIEESKHKKLIELRSLVEEEYQLYHEDPFIVSASHNSLFLKKSMEDRLKMGCDSLTAWLRSVREAKTYQKVFLASLQKESKRFFIPRLNHPSRTTRPLSISQGHESASTGDIPIAEACPPLEHVPQQSTICPSDFDPG
jgi:hypothetical protein